MKRPLSREQRAARRSQTYSRQEAAALIQKYGQPFVHAGDERYTQLGATVYHAGLEPTLTLIQDKRSLLTWPLYLMSGQAAMLGLFAVGLETLTHRELRQLDPRTPMIDQLAGLVLEEDASPAALLARQLALDLQAMLHERQQRPDLLAEVPRSPEAVMRVLNTISTSAAVMGLLDYQQVDTEMVRRTTSNVINDPERVIRMTGEEMIILR